MTNFIPHTPDERREMLDVIGVASEAHLFDMIPASLRTPFALTVLPQAGMPELEVQQHLTAQAAQNSGATMQSFQGGGAYAHFVPPAVNSIASRSEFYTAYTPYQPEVSQGTLQMIYEFQTMMCELTGMDVTNASVYDGASALSEAVFMAIRATRRKVVYVAETMNPHFRQVLDTYVHAFGDVTIRTFNPALAFEPQVADAPNTVAGVVLQTPDYLGSLHDLTPYQSFTQANGALLVVSVNPMLLGVLAPPSQFGAHIVCGDIQPFGNPVNFGGPYGGFVATTEKWMRQLPGRLVGRTVDKTGRTAYTLTLQTREQHIRRDKATSNICTNQSLNILKASVFMSLVGPQGLAQLATVCMERAHWLADRLLTFPGVTLRIDKPFGYEFALRLPLPAQTVITAMAGRFGIVPGIDVGRYWPGEDHTLLVAVTELNSLESLERYVQAFEATLNQQGLSKISSGLGTEAAMIASGTATGTMGRTR